MRHFVGIVAVSVAVAGVITGCVSRDGDVTETASSPATTAPSVVPSRTPMAPSSTTPSRVFETNKGSVVLFGELSVPAMEGWKVVQNGGGFTKLIDTSKKCSEVSGQKPPSCPYVEASQLILPSVGGAKEQDQCSLSIFKEPVGSDRVGGISAERYRVDPAVCSAGNARTKLIEAGLDPDVSITYWHLKHGGKDVLISAVDGMFGPKIDVEKLTYSLGRGKWLN